jgi:hypothetical protein
VRHRRTEISQRSSAGASQLAVDGRTVTSQATRGHRDKKAKSCVAKRKTLQTSLGLAASHECDAFADPESLKTLTHLQSS